MQTIDTSSNGTAVLPAIATGSGSSTESASEPAESSSRTHRIAAESTSSPADAGAATQAATAKENDNKAVSAGAAIGGVVGLLLVISAILFALRWWMRRKRDNRRKTILMRQSWYPPGFDGPDHIVESSQEVSQDRSHLMVGRQC